MTNYIMFTEPGRFVVGCNYWASHDGTAMWSDWRPDVVDEDLRKLAAAGLQVLRVFPRGVAHDLHAGRVCGGRPGILADLPAGGGGGASVGG